MMFYPPFMSFPFNKRYHSFYVPPPKLPPPDKKTLHSSNLGLSTPSKSTSVPPLPRNKTTSKPEYSKENSQVFNILGITLHFDDILIVCLLFFLYSEGVQDEMLFMALILLLLT